MTCMYNMQNMQNMQTWTPVAFVLLQHRNKGTRVLFYPSIGLGFTCEQHWYTAATAEAICRTRYNQFGAEKRLRRFQAGG
jgi:hypothetical protein